MLHNTTCISSTIGRIKLTKITQRKTTLASGFGGSYDSYAGETLSLDKLVRQTPSATYYMRVSGDNAGARLENGDIVVVDRSLTPNSNDIVVAIVESELVIRRFTTNEDLVELYRDGEQPSEVMKKEDFQVWGVVTFSLTDHRNKC